MDLAILVNSKWFFNISRNPLETQNEINKGIEREKVGISRGTGDSLVLIGYLIIGTDENRYNLQLNRDPNPWKYGRRNVGQQLLR